MGKKMNLTTTLARLGLVALIVGALAACGGGGGGAALPAAPGGGGAPAPGAAPPAPVPPGAAVINVGNLTADQLAALQPNIVFGGAAVTSPPQVSFAVQDPNGNPIIGFQAATTGLRFTMAKLVPGAAVPGTTTTTPSKWVNYVVINSSGAAQRPNYEVNGTLVDNGNGTYVYTFATDITTVKDQIAAMTFTAPNAAADLGDLTYNANLTHRIVIQLSGGIDNPVNGIYDFIPATGKTVTASDTQREVVSVDSCNQCHGKLTLHGARVETRYCVTCHTDQRRYGRTNTASTNLAFPALTETATVNATTGFTSYSYAPDMYVADGETLGDFPRLIHKMHQGHSLVKQNYEYANVAFNLKAFSMLDDGQRSCRKCHDNTKAAQADNWKNLPSRIACGACHDGINFATGTGTTLSGAATGHVGGAQPDTRCALCHDATNIPVYHETTDITKHNPTIPAGLVTFTYEIESATVDAATNNVTIKFRINRDGTAVTLLAPAAGRTTSLTGYSGSPGFLLAWAMPQDGITTPIDFNNINAAVPSAFGTALGSEIKGDARSVPLVSNTALTTLGLLDTNNAANGSISGPDAAGFYTATLLGTGSYAFPVGAKMRTVGLQSGYTQSAGTNGIAANTARNAISVTKTVTGDTARRQVIDPAKCTNCHEWLKLHGGSRVLAPETTGTIVCVLCHVPAKATSARGISNTTFTNYISQVPPAATFSADDKKILAEWGISIALPLPAEAALQFPVTTNNFKDMIHGIHKGRERVAPFRDARDRTTTSGAGVVTGAITLLDFRRLDFPGIINKCETCHAPGAYSDVSVNAFASVYESVNPAGMTTTALAKAALSQPNATDTVTSPFAAACVSCHDSTVAKTHMEISGGGQLNVARSALVVGREQCAFCHGPGKIVDVAVAHK